MFKIPYKENEKLRRVVELVDRNKELQAYLKCANINAIDRMGYSDHGYTHAKIVANIALKMLRILVKHGATPSIVRYHEMREEDAEVVVVLAGVFHDIGMAVHREAHDLLGVPIAYKLLNELLGSIYDEEKRATVISETMQAMLCHDRRAKPLTVEAGIISIADALDMAKGRARIPFTAGKVNIHSVSALAIDRIEIAEGGEGEEPVKIKIYMSNSAGIFQIDQLLRKKVLDSGLKEHFSITAEIEGEGEEKIILNRFEL
jgi:hypothetical protein